MRKVIGLGVLVAAAIWAQARGSSRDRPLTWQRVGSPTFEMGLAGPAGGPILDVNFSRDGKRLFAQTARGEVWSSEDMGESWQRAEGWPRDVPRGTAGIQEHPFDSRYVFALGRDLHRSSDRGRSWVNLTADGAGSIIGSEQQAIAFSPLDPELIFVANARGLWRSADGGLSWSDVNRGLPNLPAAKFLATGNAAAPAILLQGIGAAELDGGAAWRPAPQEPGAAAARTPEGISATAAAGVGEYHYAGTSDGNLWVSRDGGARWQAAREGFAAQGNAVTGIFVDAREPRTALVVVGARQGGRVFRTTNGGVFWDDLTADLPEGAVNAVTANPETGSIYVASASGVFHTRGDLRSASAATPWTRLNGNLPLAAAEDVHVHGGSLYAAVTGFGIFRTTVPDIADALRVVNAADLTERAAAPGGLLTVVGSAVRAARAGALTAPVLASGPADSQIQVPFEATGKRLDLALETQRGAARVGVPLEEVSPAIFVDSDGTPLVVDSSGTMLEATRPARAGSEIVILTTGLGRVRPDWPTGLAAPLEDPPVTMATITAFLDGAALRVLSSTLAGGYIGVYMVRVELPGILNSGTGELAIAAGDKTSNKVRIYLAP